MVNVISELEKLGLELTDEQKEAVKKSMGEELFSKAELEKKVKAAETDRDEWKTRAETAEETLKGFDGKDMDAIKKERDEWKEKAEKAEKDYNAKIAAREKEDLLTEAMKDVKFTSESARKSIMAEITASVSVKNGKLIGFSDLLEEAKKNDSGAFVDEQKEQDEDNQAQFTQPMGGSDTEKITGDPEKMDFETYKKWRNQNQ